MTTRKQQERRERVIAERFESVFGYPYDKGKARLKTLLLRSANMGAIVKGGYSPGIDVSRVSMTEGDFTLIAFFAFLGAGALSDIGIEEPKRLGAFDDTEPTDTKQITAPKIEE